MKNYFHLSAYKRNGLWKVIPSGLITLSFGFLYLFLEFGIMGPTGIYPSTGNVYNFANQVAVALPASLLLGILVALLEVLVFDKLFIRRLFIIKVFVKSIVYVLIVLAFLIIAAVFANAINRGESVFHPEVWGNILRFLDSMALWGLILYIGAIITVVLFVNEVFDYFGKRITLAYLFGKYHTPKNEARIFMFMDLKSSTAIAEKLGHVEYFRWLNRYYQDITEYILNNHGDIYQYVGDEIIITWEKEHGLEHERCLDCFFSIESGLRKHYGSYMKQFGIYPEFKAGMHMGTVTTGEIGMIKKEIIFSGDVLNTTARLESNCNVHDRKFLVSKTIVEAIGASEKYQFESLGVIGLRGKSEPLELFAVSKKK